jgi:hypothetical protein
MGQERIPQRQEVSKFDSKGFKTGQARGSLEPYKPGLFQPDIEMRVDFASLAWFLDVSEEEATERAGTDAAVF